jgi:hypothetical protein
MRTNRLSVSAARAGLYGACVAFLCLGGAAQAATKLYKWVDAQGVTHWSDTPVEGAKKVDVAPAQSYSAPPTQSRPAPAPVAKAPPVEPANAGYTRIAIVRPQSGETFANVSNIEIGAETDPPLEPAHDPWIVLDGKRVANGMSVIVSPERGSHTVHLEIENSAGKVIATSPGITFHVQKASIQTPPRGPSLKNRPARH